MRGENLERRKHYWYISCHILDTGFNTFEIMTHFGGIGGAVNRKIRLSGEVVLHEMNSRVCPERWRGILSVSHCYARVSLKHRESMRIEHVSKTSDVVIILWRQAQNLFL